MLRARWTNPRLCEVLLVAGISLVQRMHAAVGYKTRASDGRSDCEARWSPCKVLVLKGLNVCFFLFFHKGVQNFGPARPNTPDLQKLGASLEDALDDRP